MDLRNDSLRPELKTSTDAAGLAVLPGLLRYEEVAQGEIRHAIRFTAPQTQRAFSIQYWRDTMRHRSRTRPMPQWEQGSA